MRALIKREIYHLPVFLIFLNILPFTVGENIRYKT